MSGTAHVEQLGRRDLEVFRRSAAAQDQPVVATPAMDWSTMISVTRHSNVTGDCATHAVPMTRARYYANPLIHLFQAQMPPPRERKRLAANNGPGSTSSASSSPQREQKD